MTHRDDEKWSHSCLRKRAMKENHADKVIKRAMSEGSYLRKYVCPHCSNYHLTSKPLNAKPKAEKEKPQLNWMTIETAPLDGTLIKILTTSYKVTKGSFDGEKWINKNNHELYPYKWMSIN